MPNEVLIYGANGNTGASVARAAVKRGLRPVLAGRDADAVKAIAAELSLQWTVFDLGDRQAIDTALGTAHVVLHCAGPYHATARPMVDACLRTRTHYIDITGEIDVLAQIEARHDAALKAGIMLLPACGFDVAPSDCLALHLASRLPDADTLQIAIAGTGRPSRGTMRTAMRHIGQRVVARRNGTIVEMTDTPERSVDFGDGPVPVINISWADVFTAYHSTGIPNIDVAFEATPGLRAASQMSAPMRRLLATRIGQALLARRLRRHPVGPDMDKQYGATCVLVGEVASSKTGAKAVSRLTTRGPYWLTAEVVALAAQKVVSGHAPAGYQTPAKAFGSGFVLEIDGSAMVDL